MADITQDITPNVEGTVAHDAADSGNPVKVGLKAVDHGANPTAVAANDRTDWYANRHGIPFVICGHMNVETKEFGDFTTGQTDTALVTVGAGNKIVVTYAAVMLDVDTTVTASFRLGFGTATLPTLSTSGVDRVFLSHPGLAAGSGIVSGTGAGIIGQGDDNEDLRLTSDVPTGGALRVMVTYYVVPA